MVDNLGRRGRVGSPPGKGCQSNIKYLARIGQIGIELQRGLKYLWIVWNDIWGMRREGRVPGDFEEIVRDYL